MLKMKEIYEQHKEGENFKNVSNISGKPLTIKHPADLVGSNKIMQELVRKKSKYFK
ncbi:hypothetical protein [Peribacillus loiseleuriae]|uniref:hypothetical protein n=1 Tax=Peribacillus loiseleuriae TaxID=1679170 RepID=UPI0015D5F1AD|nr:hypothetical protein [Peribacillus loiseleuriae]